MAKKDKNPPPPKKKSLAEKLFGTQRERDLRDSAHGRKGQSNTAQGKTHGPADPPNRRATHQAYKLNERNVPHSYRNCYCTQYDSDHPL